MGLAMDLGFQRVEALALVRGEVDAMYSSGSPGAINKAFLGAHTVLDISQLEDRALQVNNYKAAGADGDW